MNKVDTEYYLKCLVFRIIIGAILFIFRRIKCKNGEDCKAMNWFG